VKDAITGPTIQAYDTIAEHYLARWRDRSVVQDHARSFVAYLHDLQLTGYWIADVGCGPGFDAASFRGQGFKVFGLDLSMGMMKSGRQEYSGDFIQADMRRLPLAAVIGSLWVSASLLHLPREDVPFALQEFGRVLLPGGLLYLTVKYGLEQGWQHDAYGQKNARFFTYWQAGEIDTVLATAGFEILESRLEGEPNETRWLTRFSRLIPS